MTLNHHSCCGSTIAKTFAYVARDSSTMIDVPPSSLQPTLYSWSPYTRSPRQSPSPYSWNPRQFFTGDASSLRPPSRLIRGRHTQRLDPRLSVSPSSEPFQSPTHANLTNHTPHTAHTRHAHGTHTQHTHGERTHHADHARFTPHAAMVCQPHRLLRAIEGPMVPGPTRWRRRGGAGGAGGAVGAHRR